MNPLASATYVLNSEADQLRASGERYAEQLEAAGVQVGSEFEPGSIYGQKGSILPIFENDVFALVDCGGNCEEEPWHLRD